jgi:hypothetical protein
MDLQEDAREARGPRCQGSLVAMGSPEIAIGDTSASRRHAYWCPAGCQGPEADQTFEVIACPACGSHATTSRPHPEGVEEVVCDACGTITSLQISASTP